jgi:hypothetical protein
MVPVSEGETEKSCPALPSKERVLSSNTRSVIGLLACPVKVMVGSEVCPVLGIISMFLSISAICY